MPFRLNFALLNLAPYGNLRFWQMNPNLNKPARRQNLLCGATFTPKFRALVAQFTATLALKQPNLASQLQARLDLGALCHHAFDVCAQI